MATSYKASGVQQARRALASDVKWHEIQEKVFTRWVNDEIKQRGLHIDSLKDDLQDGIVVVHLLELISGKSLGPYNKHPRIINQKLENLEMAIKFSEAHGIKLVNIGPCDIQEGNMRIILGFIWSLIYFFEVKRGERDGKDDLLEWVQSKIPAYRIKGWKGSDWNDGRALCALIDAIAPGSYPDHASLDKGDKLANVTNAITIGEQEFGIEPLILPEELAHPRVDKLALQTYIARYRNLQPVPSTTKTGAKVAPVTKAVEPVVNKASTVRAHGAGLVEGVVNEPGMFSVNMKKAGEGKLDIKVTGPSDAAVVKLKENEDVGVLEVDYTPSHPGTYQVHVTFDDEHIPGSPFAVDVLEDMSIGCEGKIVVFYTTTSSNAKWKSDFYALQRLFEAKMVHLREDFVPWLPVDLLTRDDREAIFKKAGTRTLPICIVDDKYIGTVDSILDLEDVGKLDAIINYKGHRKLLTAAEHMRRLAISSGPGP